MTPKYTRILCGHCLLTESQDLEEVVMRLSDTIDMLIEMDDGGAEIIGEDEEGRLIIATDDEKLAAKFEMDKTEATDDGSSMRN